MTHILHRQIGGTLPVAAGGKGIEIVDTTGKRYIDASGGAAVSCLGHGHPAVTAALHEQLDKLAYAHTGFFTTEVAEKLADRLVADAPAGHQPCLSGERRIGGDRGGAQDGAAVFHRARPATAPPRHRPPPELSRQYAGRAGGRRQRMAARALLAAADRDASHRSLLRLSLPGAGRERRRPTAGAPPMRSRPRSSSSAPTR